MLKRVDIVVHVYAGKLPQYAQFLRVQIESLNRWKPKNDYRLVVMCAPREDDPVTFDAVGEGIAKGVMIHPIALDLRYLGRRAIGRNVWSHSTFRGDVIWHCDVDYAFGEGCLDAVCDQVSRNSALCFPDGYMIHRDWDTGDASWARAAGENDITLRPEEFEYRRNKIALGGLQILGSDLADQIGYMGGTRWTRPVSEPFGCFFDDTRWRRTNFPGGGQAIKVPNLYRLRHSAGTVTPARCSGRRLTDAPPPV